MKKAAFFLLATALPAFGAYSYYYTDALTSGSGNWTQNGTTTFTSGGFTSTGSSGLVSTVSSPTGSSYEVKMTLSLTQSGGMYSALLHASSNASLGTSSATGTFYSIQIANVTFTNGVCSATVAEYKIVSGTATGLNAAYIPCHNGMVVRAVMLNGGTIVVYIDNVDYLATTDTSITSGAAGISVASAPSGNTISQVQLGRLDTVAPGGISPATVGTSSFPTRVDLQWQGVLDDANGIGLFAYQLSRSVSGGSPVYIGSSTTPDFTDPNVSANTMYTYTLQAVDYHWNSSIVTVNVTTPAAGNIDPREVGLRPLGSYWGAGSEQIDMRSGNLNYSIPLIKAMARGWSASFNLTYTRRTGGRTTAAPGSWARMWATAMAGSCWPGR